MEILDEIAGQKQQLNALEFSLLSGCILAAAAAPIMGGSLTEFIAPSAAACTYLYIYMLYLSLSVWRRIMIHYVIMLVTTMNG